MLQKALEEFRTARQINPGDQDLAELVEELEIKLN